MDTKKHEEKSHEQILKKYLEYKIQKEISGEIFIWNLIENPISYYIQINARWIKSIYIFLRNLTIRNNFKIVNLQIFKERNSFIKIK